MKYAYAYKTPDGARHEEEIDAPSREAAFAALRARGVRPIKVVARDGSKANGEVRGLRKRAVAWIVAGAVGIAGTVAFFMGQETAVRDGIVVAKSNAPITAEMKRPLARQQIQGNRQRLEALPKDFFSSPAEAWLARFAEPGRAVPDADDAPDEAEFRRALTLPIRIRSDEFTEHIDLKRIVAEIKHEAKAYLDGGGTVADYLSELRKRQQTEVSYRENADKRLAELLKDGENLSKAYDFWLKANATLGTYGIHPLPLPDELARFRDNLSFVD